MSKFSKFGIVLTMLSLLLFIGCSDDPKDNSPKYKKVEINENSTIVCLGNSLTDGYGAYRSESYPAILAEKVNIPVINRGETGITTTEAAYDVLSGIHDGYLENAAVIIIELGANDLFEQMNNPFNFDKNFVSKVEESFEEILDYIKNLDTDPQIYLAKFYTKKIAEELMPSKDYMFIYDDYENMFKRLKSKYDVDIINDIWKGIWGKDNLMYDGFHPNADGYKIMSANIFNAMKGFLEFNNLVK